jgi:hypothetical protein
MLTPKETDRLILAKTRTTNMSIRHITRLKAIQIWFAAVSLVVVGAFALGAAVTIGTAALLLTMGLVPLAVVLMLWPSDNAPTMAETIHNAKAR